MRSCQPASSRLTHRDREQARSYRGFGLAPGLQQHLQSLWERGCLRCGHVSQHLQLLTHRDREQARSYRGFGLAPGLQQHLQSLWERGCLRCGHVSQHLQLLTHRDREQARSYRGLGWFQEFSNTINHCGSEPARERSCQPASSTTDTPRSRAGSLLQGVWAGSRTSATPPITVGASLLAMRSCQSASSTTDTPRSRAGSLLQGVWAGSRTSATPPITVGARLLAMWPCQPASSATDTPRSRAGSLLQEVWAGSRTSATPSITVGASLLAMRSCQPASSRLTHRDREQARSYRECVPTTRRLAGTLTVIIESRSDAGVRQIAHGSNGQNDRDGRSHAPGRLR